MACVEEACCLLPGSTSSKEQGHHPLMPGGKCQVTKALGEKVGHDRYTDFRL